MPHNKRFLGQSLIEFALILPLFILMVTVLIDLGRLISVYSQISNAVREGTRYAVVHQSGSTTEQDAIKDVIDHFLTGIILDSVTITAPTTTSRAVNIEAHYLYVPITPGLKYLISGGAGFPLVIKSSSTVAPVVRLTPIP